MRKFASYRFFDRLLPDDGLLLIFGRPPSVFGEPLRIGFFFRIIRAGKLRARNIEKLRLQEAARLYAADWRQALSQMKAEERRFDLVFLDPPYQSGLLEQALDKLTRFDILNPHGIIVAEHPADRRLPMLPPPYRLRRTYRYGKIAVSLYRREKDQENEEERP